MLRTGCLSTSPRCFSKSFVPYETLIRSYDLLSGYYQGWTLTEIRDLSSRERINWLDIIREKVEAKK